jgi:hypothetical protein
MTRLDCDCGLDEHTAVDGNDWGPVRGNSPDGDVMPAETVEWCPNAFAVIDCTTREIVVDREDWGAVVLGAISRTAVEIAELDMRRRHLLNAAVAGEFSLRRIAEHAGISHQSVTNLLKVRELSGRTQPGPHHPAPKPRGDGTWQVWCKEHGVAGDNIGPLFKSERYARHFCELHSGEQCN